MAFEEFYRLGFAFFTVFSFLALYYIFDVRNYESRTIKSLTQLIMGLGIILTTWLL